LIHKTKNRHHKFLLLLIVIAIAIIAFIRPEFLKTVFFESNFSDIFMLLAYLPGFFILVGLIEVWLPESFIQKHLGKHSGLKGALYAFFIGAAIPGPFYLAFPMAAMLWKKGVSKFNLSLFVGAWSCLKFGEEIFELQFLGLRFLLLRVFLTVPFIVLMSFIMKKVHFEKSEN